MHSVIESFLPVVISSHYFVPIFLMLLDILLIGWVRVVPQIEQEPLVVDLADGPSCFGRVYSVQHTTRPFHLELSIEPCGYDTRKIEASNKTVYSLSNGEHTIRCQYQGPLFLLMAECVLCILDGELFVGLGYTAHSFTHDDHVGGHTLSIVDGPLGEGVRPRQIYSVALKYLIMVDYPMGHLDFDKVVFPGPCHYPPLESGSSGDPYGCGTSLSSFFEPGAVKVLGSNASSGEAEVVGDDDGDSGGSSSKAQDPFKVILVAHADEEEVAHFDVASIIGMSLGGEHFAQGSGNEFSVVGHGCGYGPRGLRILRYHGCFVTPRWGVGYGRTPRSGYNHRQLSMFGITSVITNGVYR